MFRPTPLKTNDNNLHCLKILYMILLLCKLNFMTVIIKKIVFDIIFFLSISQFES